MTLTSLPAVDVAEDLPVFRDHVPEKRHEKLPADLGLVAAEIALEQRWIGHSAVFLVQEGRVCAAEHLLPPETVAGHQQDVPRLELRGHGSCCGSPPAAMPEINTEEQDDQRRFGRISCVDSFSEVFFGVLAGAACVALCKLLASRRSISAGIAVCRGSFPVRVHESRERAFSRAGRSIRFRIATRSMRWRRALVIGRLALLKLADRRNASVIGSLQRAVSTAASGGAKSRGGSSTCRRA